MTREATGLTSPPACPRPIRSLLSGRPTLSPWLGRPTVARLNLASQPLMQPERTAERSQLPFTGGQSCLQRTISAAYPDDVAEDLVYGDPHPEDMSGSNFKHWLNIDALLLNSGIFRPVFFRR